MGNVKSIIEDLREPKYNKSINESAIKVRDNIDTKKFSDLEKKLNSVGFTFRDFSMFRLPNGDLSSFISISRKNESDDLMPQITSDTSGNKTEFFVHPSTMANFNVNQAKVFADNIVKATKLVELLNKMDFESFLTKDTPTK